MKRDETQTLTFIFRGSICSESWRRLILGMRDDPNSYGRPQCGIFCNGRKVDGCRFQIIHLNPLSNSTRMSSKSTNCSRIERFRYFKSLMWFLLPFQSFGEKDAPDRLGLAFTDLIPSAGLVTYFKNSYMQEFYVFILSSLICKVYVEFQVKTLTRELKELTSPTIHLLRKNWVKFTLYLWKGCWTWRDLVK